MISLSLLLSVAAAAPEIELVGGAGLMMSCSSLNDALAGDGASGFMETLAEDAPEAFSSMKLGLEELSAMGVDLDAPLRLAVSEANGPRPIMAVELGATAPEAFAERVRADLEAPGSVRVEGQRVIIVTPLDPDEDGGSRLGDGGDLAGVLRHIDEGARGCWIAMDLADGAASSTPLDALGAVAIQGFADHPDRFMVAISGLPLPEEAGDVGEGVAPWRSPLGSGTVDPLLVVRLNLDMQALIDLLVAQAEARPAASGAAGMFSELSGSRLRLAPGAEVALWMSEVGPRFAAVVPVRRPLRARWVLKRLARRITDEGGLAEWDGDVLRLQLPDAPIELHLAALKRHLLVGVTRQGVDELLAGAGTPWLAGNEDLAAQPGLLFRMNLQDSPFAAAMAADLNPDLPDVSRIPEVATVVRIDGDVLLMHTEVEGLRELMAEAVRAAMDDDDPEALPEPLALPLSTEAATVLMTIAARQEESYGLADRYVPYAGGPRDLDALDAQTVPWEGIPALGLGPMDTPCRFQVTLNEGGYTARATCDEDGDGVQAIYVISPGGAPERVTPEGVR